MLHRVAATVPLVVMFIAGCGPEPVPPDTSGVPDVLLPDPDIVAPEDVEDALDTGADAGLPSDGASHDTDDATTPDGISEDVTEPDDSAPPEPPTFTVSERHWRLVFEDDFRGATGAPSDPYCYEALKPQCHIWPSGNTYDCDLSGQTGADIIRPWRANFIAALKRLEPAVDHDAMSDGGLKSHYSSVISARLRHLNKCTWTSYQVLNWMATDYRGNYSSRFDPTLIEVDPNGKGYLLLSAARAPVDTRCILGGTGGAPNCQLMAFETGRLVTSISYRVDTTPDTAGIYYTRPATGCRDGDVTVGDACRVVLFSPHFVEEEGVTYWVDADPRWPGLYYANRTYRCDHHIDYTPSLGFRGLTCPILNGGVMSYAFENLGVSNEDGTTMRRGRMQQEGRFEVKLRIPKGRGAFPAAWMMPESGGWPYDGGEIDVVEARDAADEVYQTYHTGKCYDPATGAQMEATDDADCRSQGGRSTHLYKGFTTRERRAREFHERDHLFTVEWDDDRLDMFINDTHTGTIAVGTIATTSDGAPAHLATLNTGNFPFRPFYWILNHSTWVAPEYVDTFESQTLRIDFVRSYERCDENHAAFCPEGGYFLEGTGCVDVARIYESPCQPARRRCIHGGRRDGSMCRVYDLDADVLVAGVDYWVDADPRWPGLFYAKVDGVCPHGGDGAEHCRRLALPSDLLEEGVVYTVGPVANPPGIFYRPDFED